MDVDTDGKISCTDCIQDTRLQNLKTQELDKRKSRRHYYHPYVSHTGDSESRQCLPSYSDIPVWPSRRTSWLKALQNPFHTRIFHWHGSGWEKSCGDHCNYATELISVSTVFQIGLNTTYFSFPDRKENWRGGSAKGLIQGFYQTNQKLKSLK